MHNIPLIQNKFLYLIGIIMHTTNFNTLKTLNEFYELRNTSSSGRLRLLKDGSLQVVNISKIDILKDSILYSLSLRSEKLYGDLYNNPDEQEKLIEAITTGVKQELALLDIDKYEPFLYGARKGLKELLISRIADKHKILSLFSQPKSLLKPLHSKESHNLSMSKKTIGQILTKDRQFKPAYPKLFLKDSYGYQY